MAEDIVQKNNESDTNKKTNKKQNKGKFLKKFFILVVLIIAVAPFWFYDITILQQKFTEISSYLKNKNSAQDSVSDNESIKQREDLAMQIVMNSDENQEAIISPEKNAIINKQIEDLQNKINELEQQLVTQDMSTLGNRLNNIESKVSKISRDKNNQALAFVILQLKMQIDLGQPYAQELAILEAILIEDPNSLALANKLAKYAITGIPTKTDLTEEFQEMITPNQIAQIIPENASWYEALWIKANSFISIKKVQTKNTSSLVMTIDEANDLIRKNNFADAILILQKQENLSDKLQEWLNKANARMESEVIINDLMTNAIVLFTSERLM